MDQGGSFGHILRGATASTVSAAARSQLRLGCVIHARASEGRKCRRRAAGQRRVEHQCREKRTRRGRVIAVARVQGQRRMPCQGLVPGLTDRSHAGRLGEGDRHMQVVDRLGLTDAESRPLGKHDRHRAGSASQANQLLGLGCRVAARTRCAVLLCLQDDMAPALTSQQRDRRTMREAFVEKHRSRSHGDRHRLARIARTQHRCQRVRQLIH